MKSKKALSKKEARKRALRLKYPIDIDEEKHILAKRDTIRAARRKYGDGAGK